MYNNLYIALKVVERQDMVGWVVTTGNGAAAAGGSVGAIIVSGGVVEESGRLWYSKVKHACHINNSCIPPELYYARVLRMTAFS